MVIREIQILTKKFLAKMNVKQDYLIELVLILFLVYPSEIAEKLFEFIALFGPPKELLSDQGKEFLNEVITQLSMICGIERKVTAPYHPQTNGLTERFNGTLVASLRKHCVTDPNSWVKWLNFILLAYRTKIHDTTKLSSYELVFGKKNAYIWSMV